jgi:alkylation response protein AidB-like acyl-CoA dehydrogenase
MAKYDRPAMQGDGRMRAGCTAATATWGSTRPRAYPDARVQRIYGGANEIMKEVITRAMGLAAK